MTDTLRILDEAIQRHIGEISEGRSLTTDWILVTHAQDIAGDEAGISAYRIVSSETQPIHTDLGLLDVGKIIAQASWDAALEGDDE